MYAIARPQVPTLSGCTICATGFEDDKALQSVISRVESLGGTFTHDLAHDVTHLVCVKAGSAKHRIACQRNLDSLPEPRVTIVRASWLAECTRAGARVAADRYALPPLAGLEVCCSGLDIEEKGRIRRICERLEASYTKNLAPSCTHLICAEPSGRKYDFARNSESMKIVRSQWIFECEKSGLLMDEREFALEDDHGEEASGAESVLPVPPSDTPSVVRCEPKAPPPAPCVEQPKARVLPNWQAAQPGLYLNAFTCYLSTSPMQYKSNHMPLRTKALQLLAYSGASLSEELTPRVNCVVIISTPVTRSKIPEIENAQKLGTLVVGLDWLEKCVLHQKLIAVENLASSVWAIEEDATQDQTLSQVLPQADFRSTVFQGTRCALGPLALYDNGLVAKTSQKLQRGRGKVLVHDERGMVSSGVATHVVCGPSLPAGTNRLIESARKANTHVVLVTTVWADKCLDEERLLPTADCVLFRPVGHETPLRDMELRRVTVTISGYQAPGEAEWDRRRTVLARLARLLGATYSERMKRSRTTHLIADGRGAAKSEKVEMAKRWGIAIVSHKWLLACARDGCVVNAADYPYEEEADEDEECGPADAEAVADGVGEGDVSGDAAADEIRPAAAGRGGTPRRRNSVFQVPTAQRRSPRFSKDAAVAAAGAVAGGGSPMGAAKIQLFKRFTDGLNLSAGAGEAEEAAEPAPRRRSARSRSVSLDAHDLVEPRQWSLDASQSQVIVHRDLTPPPTPRVKAKRSMPPRAAKRRKTR